MKVAVVGSRRIKSYKLVAEFIDEVLKKEEINKEEVTIVSGGAPGVDSAAQEYAKRNGIPILIFYPDWKRWGRKAGPIRNSKIVREADILIAVPDSDSQGTWDSVLKARKKGIKVYIKEVS